MLTFSLFRYFPYVALLLLSGALARSESGFAFDDEVHALVSSFIVGPDFVTLSLVQGRCDLTVIYVNPKGSFSPETHYGKDPFPVPVKDCFVVVRRNSDPVPGYDFDFDKFQKEVAHWNGHRVLVRCRNAKTTIENGVVSRIDAEGVIIEDDPPKAAASP